MYFYKAYLIPLYFLGFIITLKDCGGDKALEKKVYFGQSALKGIKEEIGEKKNKKILFRIEGMRGFSSDTVISESVRNIKIELLSPLRFDSIESVLEQPLKKMVYHGQIRVLWETPSHSGIYRLNRSITNADLILEGITGGGEEEQSLISQLPCYRVGDQPPLFCGNLKGKMLHTFQFAFPGITVKTRFPVNSDDYFTRDTLYLISNATLMEVNFIERDKFKRKPVLHSLPPESSPKRAEVKFKCVIDHGSVDLKKILFYYSRDQGNAEDWKEILVPLRYEKGKTSFNPSTGTARAVVPRKRFDLAPPGVTATPPYVKSAKVSYFWEVYYTWKNSVVKIRTDMIEKNVR